MIMFIARRVLFMVLTMFVVSLLVFLLLEVNGDAVAIRVLGPYTSEEQRQLWLESNGYLRPAYVRFGEWLVNVLQGDFGESIRFKVPVSEILWDRLSNTAILGGLVFAIMVPLGIILGVIAGMDEGSPRDRVVTFVSVITTSIPEFASAVFLSVVFVFTLKWLPGTSSMIDGFDWAQIVLPVAVLVIYAFGYVARMMRASMAEVMQSAYIRTARLKGLPYRRVILGHALRNALIAPFTVIILQINWLLSGVIVVESFFAYKGFGALLLEAALNQDVYLVQAAALVSVFVAVLTQVISDIG
ncbi:MAG: ABC transporter permease, partial [Pseudomonadota bacterium]